MNILGRYILSPVLLRTHPKGRFGVSTSQGEIKLRFFASHSGGTHTIKCWYFQIETATWGREWSFCWRPSVTKGFWDDSSREGKAKAAARARVMAGHQEINSWDWLRYNNPFQRSDAAESASTQEPK